MTIRAFRTKYFYQRKSPLSIISKVAGASWNAAETLLFVLLFVLMVPFLIVLSLAIAACDSDEVHDLKN